MNFNFIYAAFGEYLQVYVFVVLLIIVLIGRAETIFFLKNNNKKCLCSPISIHTDFALSGAAEQLNALKAARDTGDLSQKEYLKKLQLRGVLPAGFDFEGNEKALALESESKPVENVLAE
jgi:hypothetical protein